MGQEGGCAMMPLVILLFFYIIPTGVAANRKHPNFGAICALNILLGWTFIGWVAALVWALITPKRQLTDDEIIAAVRRREVT
jgi:hypothetical protein